MTTTQLHVAPVDEKALEVAHAAFNALQKGVAFAQWDDFVDLLTEDVRLLIPVPVSEENPPEGLIVGDDARERFVTHHYEKVNAVRLEGKRVSANGPLVFIEARVEGGLDGEEVANHFVFVFEVAGGKIAAMYQYAAWTAKRPESGWGDPSFAREAFPETVIPFDEVAQ